MKTLFDRVQSQTGWGDEKTYLWFRTKNPMLGEVSPTEMIEKGRGHRLAKFISEAESWN